MIVPNEMKISETKEALMVFFYGDLDHETTLRYRDRLVSCIEESIQPNVIFNFKHVHFIDSSGIGMVLGRYNQLTKSQRQLFLSGMQGSVYRLFDLTGLFKIIQCLDDTEESDTSESNGNAF